MTLNLTNDGDDSANVGLIVGSTIGGLFLFIAVIVAIFCFFKKKSANESASIALSESQSKTMDSA